MAQYRDTTEKDLSRNRDKLLPSVKFGAMHAQARIVRLDSENVRQRNRRGRRGRELGSSQRAALIVAYGLLDFWRVFMTNGPYCTTGSRSGRPARTRNRAPSGPAVTSMRSPDV